MMDLDLGAIQRLEAEFGTPLYIFDELSFIQNYRDFEDVFRRYYPNYRIAYSYKTNYTPYVCALVGRLGGYAEVVSGMEYQIAKRVGYSSGEIIFNGPNKGRDGLSALADGCIVNVDNVDELKAVCAKAEKCPGRFFEIGLRVNLDVGQGFVSRFGMDPEVLPKTYETVEHVPNIRVVGLHCHISRCRSVDAWRKRTETMLSLSDELFRDGSPKYIDLGSGMFGKMDPELAAQFESIPSYEEYAEVTAKLVAKHYGDVEDAHKPILFTEPGTTLINRYVDFVGRIDAVKTIRGKSIAVLNCSEHNLGETCVLKRLPMRVINAGEAGRHYTNVDFVGYTCLEQDVMYEDYNGGLATGDYVQFGNVGGYSNVNKPPFIWPNCAMVAKKENGDYRIIKRKETYEDLLRTYVF